MYYDNFNDDSLIRSKKMLDITVLPFFTNLFYLIFIIFSFDIFQSNSAPTNIVALFSLFYWYLVGLIEFIAYGKTGGGLSESLKMKGRYFIVLLVIITYPVFYLFWLPLVLYNLIFFINSPRKVWQRLFENSLLSLEFLVPNYATDCGSLFLAYLYIGIPFFLFSLIYIGVIVLLTPFWYFLFSHFGLSMLGICLHITLHFPNFNGNDLNNRIDRFYPLGNFLHIYIMCLPSFIIGLVYCFVVSPEWYALCLLVASGVNFLLGCFTSIKALFTTSHKIYGN